MALLTISHPLTSGCDVAAWRWIRRGVYLTIGCTPNLLHHPPFVWAESDIVITAQGSFDVKTVENVGLSTLWYFILKNVITF